MTNNDILRRLRYALNLSDPAMIEIFKLADYEIDRAGLTALMRREGEEGYVECSEGALGSFLDGLIAQKRGRKPVEPGETRVPSAPLTNNAILKKIRIALELKEDDMLCILKLADVVISKSELTALFRRADHRNFKECGDQFLRKFMRGLSLRQRS